MDENPRTDVFWVVQLIRSALQGHSESCRVGFLRPVTAVVTPFAPRLISWEGRDVGFEPLFTEDEGVFEPWM